MPEDIKQVALSLIDSLSDKSESLKKEVRLSLQQDEEKLPLELKFKLFKACMQEKEFQNKVETLEEQEKNSIIWIHDTKIEEYEAVVTLL